MAYYLAANPEWQDRLREDSARIGDGPLDIEALEKLETYDLVINESLRMQTPLPFNFRQAVRDTEVMGHFIPAVAHLTALRARGMFLKRTIEETFENADVMLLPVLADPLPTIAELDVGGGANVAAAMGRVVKFTRAINYLGLPAITLPIPRGSGLPNGFQLVGKPYSEALLMAIGQAYQQEVPPEIARPIKS